MVNPLRTSSSSTIYTSALCAIAPRSLSSAASLGSDLICPCGSQRQYLLCCGQYLSSHTLPSTPEALMRSRYTAYTRGDISYISATMQGKPHLHFNAKETEKWAMSVHWLGLRVIQVFYHETDPCMGFVEFKTSYIQQDILRVIHEISQFQFIKDRWFYVDGNLFSTPPQRIARKAACSCNSGKKFKYCHAK